MTELELRIGLAVLGTLTGLIAGPLITLYLIG